MALLLIEKAPTAMALDDRSMSVPDPIDISVGAKLRELRKYRGMSQTALGSAAGVSFQQQQKYETGQNRIAASTLWRLAQALGFGVERFFEGL